MNIILEYNLGFKWISNNNNVYVKGYLFDENNNLYQDESLIEYFSSIRNEVEFEKKLKKSNGLFSVIIKLDKETLLVGLDRLRTFPLFYYVNENEIYVSDNSYAIKNKFNLYNCSLAKDEFICSGFTTSKFTLVEKLFQLEASEILTISNKNITRKFYYDYTVSSINDKGLNFYRNELHKVFENITDRLIKSANGKTIVVPLSGGYDSRLIVSLLKLKGYSDVICYTYGSKSSFEIEISKKVASELSYKWYYIEYTEELIKGYSSSTDFEKYWKFASNNTSSILLQDYFAVKYLKENDLIPLESIIVSGCSGDFLAGSQINHKIGYSKEAKVIKEEIFNKTYILNSPKNNSVLLERINEELNNGYSYSIVENSFIRRKIAKYIVNSHRIYEFFGFEHRFVLWDNEITDFFKKLPIKYKKEPFFYENVLRNDLFMPLNIDFVPPDKIGRNDLKSKAKGFIKSFIPKKIVMLRESLINKDINNFDLMTNELKKELGEKADWKINLIIAKWIVKKNG